MPSTLWVICEKSNVWGGERDGQRGQTDTRRSLGKLLRKVAGRLSTLEPHLIILAPIVRGCNHANYCHGSKGQNRSNLDTVDLVLRKSIEKFKPALGVFFVLSTC